MAIMNLGHRNRGRDIAALLSMISLAFREFQTTQGSNFLGQDTFSSKLQQLAERSCFDAVADVWYDT